MLIAVWLSMSPSEGRWFVLETATATVLSTKRSDDVLRLMNHRCMQKHQIPENDDIIRPLHAVQRIDTEHLGNKCQVKCADRKRRSNCSLETPQNTGIRFTRYS